MTTRHPISRMVDALACACVVVLVMLAWHVAVRLMCVPWRLDDLERKIDAIAERVEQ